MKRTIIWLLTVAMLVPVLAACGKSGNEPERPTEAVAWREQLLQKADEVVVTDAAVSFVDGMGEELLEFIYTLDVGEFAKTEVDGGVCFVYRGNLIAGAYASDTYEYFFSDFYSDAAEYLFGQVLIELSPMVKFSPSYDEIDVVGIPVLEEFIIREWK